MCFNTDSCHNVLIYLNNMPIVNTKHDIHLGNFISCDIYDRNMDNTVCDFYQRRHGLITEFRACDMFIHVPPCKHVLLSKNIDLMNNYGHDALDYL